MRRRINTSINYAKKNIHKADKSINLLGCSFNELKIYIESLFTENMSWDKVLTSEIHLDHIRPCSSFDLSNEEEQRQCFHYTNLQPLWAIDNLKKGDNYIEGKS